MVWAGKPIYTLLFAKLSGSAPFRHLLSPNTPFKWTDDLEAAFSASKETILEIIQRGVHSFDSELETCLSTDYSKKGIGWIEGCKNLHIATENQPLITTLSKQSVADVPNKENMMCWRFEMIYNPGKLKVQHMHYQDANIYTNSTYRLMRKELPTATKSSRRYWNLT